MTTLHTLNRDALAARASEFVRLESGLPGDDWTDEHFLGELPQKWQLSGVALDANDAVAGYAIASAPEPCRAHLHRIVVAPDKRGGGVGQDLMAELVARAQALGLRQLSLKVHAANAGAIRFYQRLGFALESDVSGDYRWMSVALTKRRIVACHQPNFLPWAGYFSKLVHSDAFVILDDVQMPTGRSYVSRTRIADANGGRWLTVPVTRASEARICDVQLANDPKWRGKHLGSLRQVFAKAPYKADVFDLLEPAYAAGHTRLVQFNLDLFARVAAYFGLRREVVLASTFNVKTTSDERLLDLVCHVGGQVYLSGKGGQNYQSEDTYASRGVALDVREYKPLPYARGTQAFEPGLSIIDLIAWCGPQAISLLAYPPPEPAAGSSAST